MDINFLSGGFPYLGEPLREFGTVDHTGLRVDQREALEKKILEWRIEAGAVGPMHALWDVISDAECLLAGKKTLLQGAPGVVYAKLMAY